MKSQSNPTLMILLLLVACLAGMACTSRLRAESKSARGSQAASVKSTGWSEAAAVPVSAQDARETPGALRILDKDGNPAGLCPLKHTDVKADISGFIARVTVTQEFANPSLEKIEAVYTFPLSQNSAVDDMVMQVGDRTIRGLIKKKEEARKIYEDAKAAGHVASLLDQERPNIFTQSVANIMPGESVKITISYVEYLDYKDGAYAFAFPMVVGPRYMPGAPSGQSGTGWSPDTTQVPDASKISPPVTPEGTRAGHDISLSVTLDAGLPVGDIKSELHAVDISRDGASRASIALKDQKSIPNKDFVLKYEVAGDQIQDAVLAHARADGSGFFTLMIAPPERVTQSQIVPKEMIFVIDTSGSMSGWPVEKAKETMKYAIRSMNDNDTFNLIAFSNNVKPLFAKSQPNTAASREKAERYLGAMMGGGGTEMMPAMDAALTPPADPERVRIVCFMTDGYVGNDFEIIDYIQKNLRGARMFSFGIGNGVNRFLLDEMAKQGRGEVEYVLLESEGKGAAERFHQRIANPVLTDINIDWGGLPVSDMYPGAVPDLFSHKPVIVTGRYQGRAEGAIKITGRAAGKRFEKSIRVSLPAQSTEHDVLAPLWARRRIDDLMAKDYLGMQRGNPSADIRDQITGLGLEYRLMTQFTSFVAVEERVVTEGGIPRTVAVPVEMPEGVSYEGVFGETEADGAVGAGYMGRSVAPKSARYAAAPADLLSLDESFAEPEKSVTKEESKPGEKTANPLAPELRGLAKKVTAAGKSGNYTGNGVTVKKWIIRLRITLDTLTTANIEKLKTLGFTVDKMSGDTVTGALDVRKLDKLAKLGFVTSVTPE